MIDVKELRIGNYVFPKNDSGKESVIGEVFAINNNVVSVKGNHNPYDYHLLEGIPLTDKILHDAGFNYVDDYECYSKEIGDKFAIGIKLEKSVVDLFYITNMAVNGILTLPTSYKILFVHQLQNIYFDLTGKELTVKI